jgi:hypothetical protein
MDDLGMVPLWADFKEFDTLASELVPKVHFFADMRRRSALAQELVQGVLDPLFLKVVEGHRFNCLGEFS